jgi:hypothetical protein
MSRQVGDMKHGLTSSRPKLSILGRRSMIHQSRGNGYGADKYARGNYHGPAPEGVTPEARVMGYVDAAMRHLTAISDAYNHAVGTGGDARAAIALPDLESSGGFPASGLPHLSHVLAGIGIAIECAVDDGLLPEDPGEPWKAGAEDSLPQKDDPAAERARVAGLAGEHRLTDADWEPLTFAPVPDLDAPPSGEVETSLELPRAVRQYREDLRRPFDLSETESVGEPEVSR